MTLEEMYALGIVTLSIVIMTVYLILTLLSWRYWRRWRDSRAMLAFLSSFVLLAFAAINLIGASSLMTGPVWEARIINGILRGLVLIVGIVLVVGRWSKGA